MRPWLIWLLPIFRSQLMSSLRDRFNSKIKVTPSCWVWTASIGSTGYGQISASGGPKKAHRVSYEMHIGPIPDGLCVLHKCDNPVCVNPAHLFLGTRTENAKDKVSKGRQARGVGHGLKGADHPAAKLDAEKVKSIRLDVRSSKEISDAFGVSRSLVVQIKARTIWRHV
jgi:hypothetical protein